MSKGTGLNHEEAKRLAKRFVKEGNAGAMLSVMRQAEIKEPGSGDEIRKQLAKDFRDKEIRY